MGYRHTTLILKPKKKNKTSIPTENLKNNNDNFLKRDDYREGSGLRHVDIRMRPQKIFFPFKDKLLTIYEIMIL